MVRTLYPILIACCITNSFISGVGSTPPPLLHDELIKDYFHAIGRQFHGSRQEFKAYKDAWRNAVYEGGRLTYQILSGHEITYTLNAQEQHLGNIRKVISFLYSMSIPESHTQTGCSAGAFLIRDPDKRLYNFLYASSLKHEADPKTNHNKNSINAVGYTIDVTEHAYPQDFIPGKVSVYFVYNTKHNATFIRPESKSRNTPKGQASHFFSGILSKTKKALPTGADDADEYNKPHVPQDIQSRYKELVATHVNDPTERDAYEKECEEIATILRNLDRMQSNVSQQELTTLQSFKDDIYARFTYHTLRIGSEFIFGVEPRVLGWYYNAYPHTTSDGNQKQNNNAATTISQYRTTIEKLMHLRHALFLYRHKTPNTIYAQRYKTPQTDVHTVEQHVSTFLDQYKSLGQLPKHIADTEVTKYLQTASEKLHQVKSAHAKDYAHALNVTPLLDDPNFT